MHVLGKTGQKYCFSGVIGLHLRSPFFLCPMLLMQGAEALERIPASSASRSHVGEPLNSPNCCTVTALQERRPTDTLSKYLKGKTITLNKVHLLWLNLDVSTETACSGVAGHIQEQRDVGRPQAAPSWGVAQLLSAHAAQCPFNSYSSVLRQASHPAYTT